MNYANKKHVQKLSTEVGSYISNGKRMALEAIRIILAAQTSEEHTFIELDSPVGDYEEITRVYRDGGVRIKESISESIDDDKSIEDLNVSQLFDLLIALDENGTNEEEVA
jgi:hypothetical protein